MRSFSIPVLSVVLTVSAIALTGCKMPWQSSDSSTASTDSAPTPSPTPTYGMNCTSAVGGQYSSPGTAGHSYNNLYFVDSISGSSINYVELQLALPSSVGNSNIVGSLTLTIYTCGSSSSPGANIASKTLSNTTLNGFYAAKRFDFSSSPITIPTNCAAGEKPIAFQLTTSTSDFGGYSVYTEVGYPANGCSALHESSSNSGLSADAFAPAGVINANP